MLRRMPADEYMTTAEVAEMRRMTAAALAVERHEASAPGSKRSTPPYFKLGRRVLYRRGVVEQWIEQHMVDPAQLATPKGAA